MIHRPLRLSWGARREAALNPDRFPAQTISFEQDDALDFAVAEENAALRPLSGCDMFVLRGSPADGNRVERPAASRDFLDLAAVSAADWAAVLSERPGEDENTVVILSDDPIRRF